MYKQAPRHIASAPTDAVGLHLYYKVLGAFVTRRTSLNKWCNEHDIHHQNAKACLIGAWDGPKARELRRQLLMAAGIERR